MHPVMEESSYLTVSPPMIEIAKDTALQPQASSLTTQNIGIRHPSESLSSSTPTSPDSLSSLGPTNRGEISEHKMSSCGRFC